MTAAPPTIPVASITLADGNAIRAAITAGPTTGNVRKHPSHPGIRDGDFENGIIIHEYGHGVSNRLTGGPAVNCLSGNEQAGEGWSDYLAISFLLDPALDDPDQPRGMGPYALFQADRHGAGIRPRPYARDMSIQPFTYDSIKTGGWLNGASLALPHGLGHGWASVLWDLNWDLIDKYGFNPNIYGAWNTGGNNRAIQYVMDGLKLQGCGPGLVVARAAIIAAADTLTDGADTCTVWATFARRGLGYSAVQGTTNRDDNSEAFDTHPDCLEGFIDGIEEGPTLNTLIAGNTRAMTFTAQTGPGRGHPREPAVLPAGRLQHARDGRPGVAVHHAAADPGEGRDAGRSELHELRRQLQVPVEDAPGMGRHLPRVRAHAQRRRAAPGVLPLLEDPVVPRLRTRPERGRHAGRGRDGLAEGDGQQPDHGHDRRERLLRVREHPRRHVRGDCVGVGLRGCRRSRSR